MSLLSLQRLIFNCLPYIFQCSFPGTYDLCDNTCPTSNGLSCSKTVLSRLNYCLFRKLIDDLADAKMNRKYEGHCHGGNSG